MLISTVLMWLLIALGIAVALPSIWLVAEAMATPETTRWRRDRAAAGILRNLFFGLLPAVAAFLSAAGLLRVARGAAGIFVLAGVGLLLVWALIGAGGLARLVGERLWPDDAQSPLRTTARGGMLLVGCCLLPVFGWFGLLPLLLVAGLGIQVRGLFTRRQPPTATMRADHDGPGNDDTSLPEESIG
ncbi:MAG: hypothetical protein ACO37F_03300 [Pirellulales bacterium]